MNWASKRKLIIFLILAFPVLLLAAYAAYPYINPAPTCFDGTQNGIENGIDCGGSCTYICRADVAPIVVEFTRPLEVLPSLYTVVSYIANPNADAYVETVPYTIRLYDSKNILIEERSGSTFVMPGGTTPVVETGFRTSGRMPARAVLTLPEEVKLIRFRKEDIRPTVSRRLLLGESASPRLEATLSNSSLLEFDDLEVIAVVFDTDGNARAASKTVILRLGSDASQDIVFTWPEPFGFTPGRMDVIPRVSPI